MKRRSLMLWVVGLMFVAASANCDDDDDDNGGADAGPVADAGPADGGPVVDGGPTDGGPTDGGPADGGDPLTLRNRFKWVIQEVTSAAPGQKPVVKFRVEDPTNNNQAYDITTAPEFKATGASARIHLGWPVPVYTNEGGSTTAPGQPVRIDLIAPPAGANLTPTGDGSFTVTSPIAIPAGVTGTGTAQMEGHPIINGQNIPVQNEVKYFAITDTQPKTREDIVTVDKCNACHGYLRAHGDNRNNNTQSCALCHNPSATDAARANAVTPPANDQPIDFKTMIHLIHGGGFVKNKVTIYGFGTPPTPHEFPAATLPDLSNCTTCHAGTTYDLPRPTLSAADATNYDTTVDANDVANLADNTRIPGTYATCVSCHDAVSFENNALADCTEVDPNTECYHGAAPNRAANCGTCHNNIAGHNVP